MPRLMLVSIPLRMLAAQPRRAALSRTKRSLVFRYMYTNRLLLKPASPAGEALLQARCVSRMTHQVELGFNCYRGRAVKFLPGICGGGGPRGARWRGSSGAGRTPPPGFA